MSSVVLNLKCTRSGLPGSDQVREREKGPEKDTDTADDNVRNTHEWVLTTDNGARRQKNRFCSAIFSNRKAYGMVS